MATHLNSQVGPDQAQFKNSAENNLKAFCLSGKSYSSEGLSDLDKYQLNPYFIMDLKKKIKHTNHAFKRLLEYTKLDLNNILLLDIMPKKYHGTINEIINKHLSQKDCTSVFECEYISKYGRVITVEQRFFLLKDNNENKKEICVSLKDITMRKRFENYIKKLQKERTEEKRKYEEALKIDKKMSSIFNLNHLIDFIVHKTSDILNAQRCSLMIYDDQKDELLIKGAKGIPPEVIKNTRVSIGTGVCGIAAKRKKTILVKDIEEDKRFKCKNKKDYRTKSFMIAPIIAHNNLLGIVNVSEKRPPNDQPQVFNKFDLRIFSTIINQAGLMIENANYYRELEYLSNIDSLTNIYNHRYFIRNINSEIKRISRYKSGLSLIMIDIDNFIEYNETYGKAEGDILIKDLGYLLKKNIREVDVACRYAGDEFVLILPETDVIQAKCLASKLLNLIKNVKSKRPITVSIGIAGYNEGIKTSDLILKSYQALYNAKKQYRDKIYCLN